MNRALLFAIVAASLGAAGVAHANCVGNGSFQTCNDTSSNNYTVQRSGNSTYMNGHNANSGNTWTQNSQTMGNTTFHNGTASNGNSWNSTTQSIGNTQFHNGTDSNGNSFSRTCNRVGTQTFCN